MFPKTFSNIRRGGILHFDCASPLRLNCQGFGVITQVPSQWIKYLERLLPILVLAIYGISGVSQAQSPSPAAVRPSTHSFEETSIPLREFRVTFERSLAQRAKDVGLPAASYSEVAAQVTEFVQTCSSLTAEQVGSTQASSPDRDGKPFYFAPRLQLLEGGKYKDCSRGRVFQAPANGKDITFSTSITNWDRQQRKFTGPKMHVWAYFKISEPGAAIGLSENGKRYGILNANIFDGTTPEKAPPAKSFKETMREVETRSRPRMVVGEYVCPGTVLRVMVHNEVFNTYVDWTSITVKQPARIARTDQTGAWFQQIGSGKFYYQIRSGPGSQASCSQ